MDMKNPLSGFTKSFRFRKNQITKRIKSYGQISFSASKTKIASLFVHHPGEGGLFFSLKIESSALNFALSPIRAGKTYISERTEPDSGRQSVEIDSGKNCTNLLNIALEGRL